MLVSVICASELCCLSYEPSDPLWRGSTVRPELPPDRDLGSIIRTVCRILVNLRLGYFLFATKLIIQMWKLVLGNNCCSVVRPKGLEG